MSSERKRQFRTWHDGYQALGTLHRAVSGSGLDEDLLELVKVRASQINGCAYCVDMHTKDARSKGESEQRLYALSAWRETPFFSGRERAALALTEAVTLVTDHDRLERAVAEAAEEFPPDELTRLLYAVIEINAWNRLAVTTGAPEAGTYQAPTGG